MWSVCGARCRAGAPGSAGCEPTISRALASSAARWRTPKRCCSSTTTTASDWNSTPGSIRACVPTTRPSCPSASRPSRSRRRAAGVEPVSSSTGRAPPSRVSSVRWCCSASVSVGAISAAWAPFSSARSIAPSATTVLPAPTSPISSRCIGRSPARSASTAAIAARWSAVSSNGSDSRQRSTSVPRAASGLARRPSRRARRRPATASWSRNSSSKASRCRASRSSSSRSGKWAAQSAAGRSVSPSSARSRPGSGSTTSKMSG